MAGRVETDEVEPRRAIRPEKRSGWWNHPPRLQPGGTSAAGSRTGGAQEKTRTSLRYADRRLSPWISAWRGSDLDYDHRGFGFLWRRRKLQYLLRAVFHKDTLASACRQRQGLYIPASRRYSLTTGLLSRPLWEIAVEAQDRSTYVIGDFYGYDRRSGLFSDTSRVAPSRPGWRQNGVKPAPEKRTGRHRS